MYRRRARKAGGDSLAGEDRSTLRRFEDAAASRQSLADRPAARPRESPDLVTNPPAGLKMPRQTGNLLQAGRQRVLEESPDLVTNPPCRLRAASPNASAGQRCEEQRYGYRPAAGNLIQTIPIDF